LSRWRIMVLALAVLAGLTVTACQSTQDKAKVI
jgi:lipopolysaccharide export system protein LptC